MTENGSGRINRGAKRRLFPPENDRDTSRNIQDLDNLVKREEAAAAREFEKRWNFDINNGIPKHGRYDWEKIDTGSDNSKPSSSLSHLPSSENGATQKTTAAKIKSATDKEVSTSHKGTQARDDRDCVDNKTSSPQEKDVNDNEVVGAIKRKTASVEEGDPKVAKRCEPP